MDGFVYSSNYDDRTEWEKNRNTVSVKVFDKWKYINVLFVFYSNIQKVVF